MSEAVELLTEDDEGRAVPGRWYPRARRVRYLPDEPLDARPVLERMHVAYPHRFFQRDTRGRPVPGTLVTFLVPDYLCDGVEPSSRAFELVVERMGWNDVEPRRLSESARL
jgi:hypothetical protein